MTYFFELKLQENLSYFAVLLCFGILRNRENVLIYVEFCTNSFKYLEPIQSNSV